MAGVQTGQRALRRVLAVVCAAASCDGSLDDGCDRAASTGIGTDTGCTAYRSHEIGELKIIGIEHGHRRKVLNFTLMRRDAARAGQGVVCTQPAARAI